MTTAKMCEFDGCDRYTRLQKGGLCVGHINQEKRGQELRPLGKYKRRHAPTCGFSGCGLAQVAKGFCHGHARHLRQGKELREIGEGLNFWENGRKVCPGCEVEKGEADYFKSTSNPTGFHPYCRECSRWKSIGSNYNLTKTEWLAIFEYQGERCAACGSDDPGSVNGWHTDHDHDHCPIGKSCGDCVMGITCHRCNIWGDRKEEPDFLAYRERVKALGIPLRQYVTSLYSLSA